MLKGADDVSNINKTVFKTIIINYILTNNKT